MKELVKGTDNVLSVHEILEFEISDSNKELPVNLVVKKSVYLSKGKNINLFDYITDLNGKAVHIPFRNRINFLWKIESGSD